MIVKVAVGAPAVPTTPSVLISRESGQCATIPGTAPTPGLQLIQQPCRGAQAETWTMQPVSGGYRIVSSLNRFCLGVAGASTADGAAIQQQSCNGGAAQKWTAVASGLWRKLVAKHSGKCLNVAGDARGTGSVLTQAACNASNRQKWTISDTPLPSAWSAKIQFPLVPVAVANMANGRLVVWSAFQKLTYGGDHGTTYTAVFDPATMTSSEQLVSNTHHDMFCPGTTTLADGRLLVNGGSSSAKTSIFDPALGTWSTGGEMSIPRGYQGNTLLSTGEVLTLGGSWSGGQGGKNAELWNPAGWRRLSGVTVEPFLGTDPAGIFRNDNHLWLAAWRDGWVFHAGPSTAMHWIDTAGTGRVIDAGPRGDDAFAVNGNAILFDVGKILKIGGAPAYKSGRATDASYVIDITGGPQAPVVVRKIAPMTFPRAMHNSVVLPTGQVVIVGGLNTALGFSDRSSVLMAELWDPNTEKFTRLSPMTTPRNYHSEALLMLDGRVFVGGGGLCGACNVNHPDAEILTPPYLLNTDRTLRSRPGIISAPPAASWGDPVTIETDAAVAGFALVRMSAATHSVNNDQRRIPLRIDGGTPTPGYVLKIPADRGAVLPGNYMLFALDANGTPSIAKVVAIR